MDLKLFHIFRNTPLGRETLLQSTYFCKKMGAVPVMYIPVSTKFLMYFENDVIQIDLDESYLTSPETARQHAGEIIDQRGLKSQFLKPKHFTASTLPDIPTQFDFMCCPRSISDLSSKIGLGYIGPRVRRIVNSALFPVLVTSPAYKEWQSLAVLFGGSVNAANALKLGIRISRTTGMPLDVYTHIEGGSVDSYKKIIRDENLEKDMENYVRKWHLFENNKFKNNLYKISHEALVVVGAFGHGLIRDFIFGSKMEQIQSTISNNLLIVGPKYTAQS